jgi:hypothetical protein
MEIIEINIMFRIKNKYFLGLLYMNNVRNKYYLEYNSIN